MKQPFFSLDISDFKGEKCMALLKKLFMIDNDQHHVLSGIKGENSEYYNKIVFGWNGDHIAIMQPQRTLFQLSLTFERLTQLEALRELIEHPLVKYEVILKDFEWFDLFAFWAIIRLDHDLLLKRKQIESIFSAAVEYLYGVHSPRSDIIREIAHSPSKRERASQFELINDKYYGIGANLSENVMTVLEHNILKQDNLLTEGCLYYNSGYIDTFLTPDEEVFSQWAKGIVQFNRKPRPSIKRRIFANIPNAETMIKRDFPRYNEKKELAQIAAITQYREP